MIRVQDLTKTYGDVRAVDGVSFEVPAGEVVGLLGPNGAGKSTTMRVLTGFLFADAGRVEVDGRAVHPEDPASKASIGYLPETTPLYPRMRVWEYLDFVGRMRGMPRAQRRAALARVSADCGLEGWERRPIGTLSKGYRQRVGLAQALFGDPKVLVLDEPTSGLDPGEIARMRALIARLAETKTVLLSTHVLAEVQETCRRVLILAGGRVVADGSTLDLAEAEHVELALTLAADEAPRNEAEAALAALPGVRSTRPLGADGGRYALGLVVEDRWATAEAVAGLARARGWTVLELRHELPSLERVFLACTEGRATRPEGAEPRPEAEA